MIDMKKLKAAIAEDTKNIREKKSHGYRDLNYEKHQATLHHAIAAHMHGHIHLSGKFLCNPHWLDSNKFGAWYERGGMTMEEQAKFIEKELATFTIAPEAPSAAPAVG